MSVTISNVSNNSALSAAYSYALSNGGGIIQLAPGTVLSNFVFNGGSSGAGPITVETAPGGGSAAVLEGVTIENTSQGLTFSGLDFIPISGATSGGGLTNGLNVAFDEDDFSTVGLIPTTSFAGGIEGGAPYSHAFVVDNATDVSFSAVNVHGVPGTSLDDTYSGLDFSGDNNLAITDSTFSLLHDAISYTGGSMAGALGVTFANNSFQYLFDDSIRGASSNELIANNNFYSNHPDPTDTDHPDFMQLWNSGDKAKYGDTIPIHLGLSAWPSGSAASRRFWDDALPDAPPAANPKARRRIDAIYHYGNFVPLITQPAHTTSILARWPGVAASR